MRKFSMTLLTSVLTLVATGADAASFSEDSVFTPYYKYRVTLTDKKGTEFSVKHPERFLSEKALARRKRQGVKVDKTDLPVNRNYVDGISAKGVKVLLTSKWNNTVLVQCEDTTVMADIRTLPFVASVRKVAEYKKAASKPMSLEARAKLLENNFVPDSVDAYYGSAEGQIKQLNGTALHEQGFCGKGVTIAVVDAGFYNADLIPMMKRINVLGTRDFVNPCGDIYAADRHGLMVLSCMGTNEPHIQVGTAPDASYWLLRSEDADTEQLVEEDYWAAAVEFADSVGVDVINTSLGYTRFDNNADNVRYCEQDGKTHLVSRSASMLASKGIVLCCSAGNEGNGTWKRISVPADARDVLTVGAVDEAGVNTGFSSLGYSADGRVKPDVVAQGESSSVVYPIGMVGPANGTSFSSPILCGMVACLWQALPTLNAYEIMELVRKSGDNVEHPDNVFGYGLPDFKKAYEMGKKK